MLEIMHFDQPCLLTTVHLVMPYAIFKLNNKGKGLLSHKLINTVYASVALIPLAILCMCHPFVASKTLHLPSYGSKKSAM